MTTTEQLQARLSQLIGEKAESTKQIEGLRRQMETIKHAIAGAQRRYDLEGDDSAADEIAELRTQQRTIFDLITDYTTQIQEYGPRIEALKAEISQSTHRDQLRTLAQRKEAELQAYDEYETTMLVALQALHNLDEARRAREVSGKTAEDFARCHGLPIPDRGGFRYPIPDNYWFERVPLEIIKREFEKARRNLAK